MNRATITGWGHCVPPVVLTNDDLNTILDTSNEWIYSRTGMRERRISHVGGTDLAYVAACRALAAAGRTIDEIDMLLVATCSPDSLLPNVSSGVLQKFGTNHMPCMDINTACTGFTHASSVANAYIRSGLYHRILIVGVDCMSHIVPWEERSVAILFGDGAGSTVMEATDSDEGFIAEKLLCYAQQRDILEIKYGCPSPFETYKRFSAFNFRGSDIFKHAVQGMLTATEDVLTQAGMKATDIDVCIPHQANQRILDAIEKRAGFKKGTIFSNVQYYANTSAATVPIALSEAIEQGRVKAGANILIPAFGGGLSCSAHLLKWGQKTVPTLTTSIDLPPTDATGLELVDKMMASRKN